jgi:hypothetical protein
MTPRTHGHERNKNELNNLLDMTADTINTNAPGAFSLKAPHSAPTPTSKTVSIPAEATKNYSQPQDKQKIPAIQTIRTPDLIADQKEMALTLKTLLGIMHSEHVKEGMVPQDSIDLLKTLTHGKKSEELTIEELWEALELPSQFIFNIRRTYNEQRKQQRN